ncbi:hypothetical protein ABC255_09580 [Neobacillus sp. 3P2-tot-E-2]|uniref:hypothetical protein n=1 Tax=Neobacillus sp. 3P2-tot-E-2 TaxID=3132212 RepID=UPI0039A3F0E8
MEKTITYNKHDVYKIISDYPLMLKIIREVGETEVEFRGTAQYGVEATLPKAQGVVGKALEMEVIRRNDRNKRLFDYLNKVKWINKNRNKLTDKRDIEILDYLLDGTSMLKVSKIIGVSPQWLDKLRNDIVDKLCE